MSKTNDGGPAFGEFEKIGDLAVRQGGITIRDYMAIHASKEDVDQVMLENFDFVTERYLITRQQARYMHANFMLSERAK